MTKKKKITKNCSDTKIPDHILKECEGLGFKGEPVVAVKYVNKLRQPVGIRDHDIEAGNIAFEINGELIISPAIGKAYFECNFVKVE